MFQVRTPDGSLDVDFDQPTATLRIRDQVGGLRVCGTLVSLTAAAPLVGDPALTVHRYTRHENPGQTDGCGIDRGEVTDPAVLTAVHTLVRAVRDAVVARTPVPAPVAALTIGIDSLARQAVTQLARSPEFARILPVTGVTLTDSGVLVDLAGPGDSHDPDTVAATVARSLAVRGIGARVWTTRTYLTAPLELPHDDLDL